MTTNSFASNITRQLARVFLKPFEAARVMSKNVDTQLLAGKFNPASGTIVDFKRPTDYKSIRTADGDISNETKSDIITGKASGVIQNYITVAVEFKEVEQALEMDQLDQLLAPMAQRMVTDLELDFADFMMKNSALLAGAPGVPMTSWEDVSNVSAIMKSHGIPREGGWNLAVNEFTEVGLAKIQGIDLKSGGASGELIKSAFQKAVISESFGGMMVMAATTLPTVLTTGASNADRAGTVVGTPNATYSAAKDTMTQTVGVTGFGTTLLIKAGETVTIAGQNRLNLATRKPIIKADGTGIVWTATVQQDVTMVGGAGNLILTGPAIFESNGSYNTVDSAIEASDVITLGVFNASANKLVQPNLFWHNQAFGIGFAELQKLFAKDTLITTKDGIRIRVSKYSDGDKNLQKVRFDVLPAYAALNPFFAGQAYG